MVRWSRQPYLSKCSSPPSTNTYPSFPPYSLQSGQCLIESCAIALQLLEQYNAHPLLRSATLAVNGCRHRWFLQMYSAVLPRCLVIMAPKYVCEHNKTIWVCCQLLSRHQIVFSPSLSPTTSLFYTLFSTVSNLLINKKGAIAPGCVRLPSIVLG